MPTLWDLLPADPFEVAAFRQRQAVRPIGGRQEGQTPLPNAMIASAIDPFGIPSWLTGQIAPEVSEFWRQQYQGNPAGAFLGSMMTPLPMMAAPRAFATAAQTAPKTTAGLLGGMLAMQPTEAETGPLSAVDVRRQRESARIQRQRLQDESRAAKDVVDLERIKAQNQLRAQQEAFAQQQRIAEETRLAQEAEHKRQREMPLRERFPQLAASLPFVGPVGGALGGFVTGRVMRGAPKLPTMLGAGLGGAGEGAIAQTLPTAFDAETLPLGSPNQVAAGQQMADPRFWLTRVGPAAGMGFAGGMLGSRYGMLQRPPMVSGAGSPLGMPQGPMSAAPVGRNLPVHSFGPSSLYQDITGRWRDPLGRFARSPD